METYLTIFLVLLLSVLIKSNKTLSVDNEESERCPNSFCVVKAQFSMYCFELVKPLFKNAQLKEEQLDGLENKLQTQEATVRDLKVDNNWKEEQLKSLRSEVQIQKETILGLNVNISSKEVKLKELEINLKTQEANARDSNITNNWKEEKLKELQSKVLTQEATVLDLNVKIRLKDVKLKGLESNLQMQENTARDLNVTIGLKDKEISELKVNATKLAEELKNRTLEFQSNSSSLSKDLVRCIDNLKMIPKSSCLGRPTDVFDMKVPGMDAFPAPCDSTLVGSGWTVIQRRQDGSVNFNRDWKEYSEGFGDLKGEFFIGLKKLHLMTKSQPHELYIYLKDFSNEVRFAQYNDFLIADEDDAYRILKLGDYTGDAGDEMEYHKNMKFTTHDRDNDEDESNCGETFQSGWWFKDCYMCNLNGPYNYKNIEANGINWNQWHYRPMKFTQMMIRPVVDE